MEKTKQVMHTPTPWIQLGRFVYAGGERAANICAAGSPRAESTVGYKDLRLDDPDFNEAHENLSLIVRAVNSHDELVEACKKALTCASISSDVRELIRAAISKASPIPQEDRT